MTGSACSPIVATSLPVTPIHQTYDSWAVKAGIDILPSDTHSEIGRETISDMPRTFSGTHDWDPSVLIDTDAYEQGNADEIIWNIDRGRCPRCERPLPTLPELPAGSRVTQCRSIPICGKCGSDEVFQAQDAACGVGWGISSAGCWPLDVEEIEERRSRWLQRMKPAVMVLGDHGDHLITEDGCGPVINPCNSGGWAQYGTVEED